MKRRAFAWVALAACLSPRAVLAQAAKKPWRVGYLSMASPDSDRRWVMAFRQGLKDLGYVEGKDLVLEQRHAYSRADSVPNLAASLMRSKVDVMVVYGSPAIAALKESVLHIPIVMTVHADPVGSGVVKSLARPGGNITGFTDGHADLAPKRLEVLKEIVPKASRIAAMFNPATAHAARQWRLVQEVAPRLGVKLSRVEIRGADEIERSFATIVKQRAEAVFVIPDPSWWVGQVPRIAELAIQHRLPTIGTVREWAEQGALVAYGTNFAELWRRSAGYVDKILKGTKPADLPIQHPTKFDLVINLRTAAALGITVPKAVTARADHLIQ